MKESKAGLAASLVFATAIPILLAGLFAYGFYSFGEGPRVQAAVQTSEMYVKVKSSPEYRKEVIAKMNLPWDDFTIDEGRFLYFRIKGVDYGYSKGELMPLSEARKILKRMLKLDKEGK